MTTATINYDRPVKNLIDELSATGHVTHTAYKKTSVTLHHNAGRLSHEGVLAVWKYRPASAHFDVDSEGAVCQYVAVNEYAWAVANTFGNQTSISIEMADASVGGEWPVADVTWKGAARLMAWLFAKVIGDRPSKDNFFYHSHWTSTSCAGPYMDKIYDQVLAVAQSEYDNFVAPSAPAPSAPAPRPVPTPPRPTAPPFPLPAGWYFGPASGPRESVSGYHGRRSQLMSWQRQMKNRGWNIATDGLFGPKTEAVVKSFQEEKGLTVDGRVGAKTWSTAWTSPIN